MAEGGCCLISCRSFAQRQLSSLKISEVISDVVFFFFNIAEHFGQFHSIVGTQVQD